MKFTAHLSVVMAVLVICAASARQETNQLTGHGVSAPRELTSEGLTPVWAGKQSV